MKLEGISGAPLLLNVHGTMNDKIRAYHKNSTNGMFPAFFLMVWCSRESCTGAGVAVEVLLSPTP